VGVGSEDGPQLLHWAEFGPIPQRAVLVSFQQGLNGEFRRSEESFVVTKGVIGCVKSECGAVGFGAGVAATSWSFCRK
jgi:hypothetical protein